MKENTLDELSRDFAQHLFARHPEWQKFARAERRPEDPADHLVVEVPVPGGDALPLVITTENDEVTVYFDYCHSHFGWPVDDKAAPYIVDPLLFIAEILDEKLASMSCWDGDQWQSSSWLEIGEDPDKEAFYKASRIKVRSWRGTRNYDYDLNRD